MSRKRAVPSSVDDDVGTPVTATKPRPDGVAINVGGTRFTTNASTLTASSAYFQRLFSDRWAEAADDYFLDRDPEPFGILLSFMRSGQLKLPKEDPALAESILLEAEFLGLNGVSRVVKARAHRNWNPEWSGDDEAAATAFDEEHGGLLPAISSGVLPSRYFTTKPDAPKSKVIQLLPAPPGCKVIIAHAHGTAVTLPVHCLALVENQKKTRSHTNFGASGIDAIVSHPY
eukprot:2656574-Prymnesium_polylepis.1